MHFVLKQFPKNGMSKDAAIRSIPGRINEDGIVDNEDNLGEKKMNCEALDVDSDAETTDEGGISMGLTSWQASTVGSGCSSTGTGDESFVVSQLAFQKTSSRNMKDVIEGIQSEDLGVWDAKHSYKAFAAGATTDSLAVWSRAKDMDMEEGPPPGLNIVQEVSLAAPLQADNTSLSPSLGSEKHPVGCSPCAWFWKAQGCQNGYDCRRCHLCPEGELKARKKSKVATLRASKPQAIDLGDSSIQTAAEPAIIATEACRASQTPLSKDAAPAKVALANATVSTPQSPDGLTALASSSLGTADLPSKGASLHPNHCRPCAWFYKPQGCNNGKECGHCHACPDGELKNRRKAKVASLRLDGDSPSDFRATNSLSSVEHDAGSASMGMTAQSFQPGMLDHPFASSLVPHQQMLDISCDSPSIHTNMLPPMSPMSPMSPSLYSMLMPAVGSLPSIGSAMHGSGKCKPCAWFWKQRGCLNGQECGHCHICPDGEIKSRRMEKVAAMRLGALVPAKGSSAARKLKIAPLL